MVPAGRNQIKRMGDAAMTRIACLQLGWHPGEDRAGRVARVVAAVDRIEGADLVVLPELWATGYFHFDRYQAEAEPLDGPTVTALAEVAARRRVHLVGGSIVERSPDGLSNTCVVLDPSGALVHAYRKVHLFGYGSDEAKLLTPGETVATAPGPGCTMGVTTCYDLRFPETYRLLVARGAQVLVVPAAWPAARLAHWRLLLAARAVENQAVVVGCNGAGTQAGTALGGHSAVVDPWGTVLAEAGDDEQVVEATVDLAAVEHLRRDFPVLDHCRIPVGPFPEPPGGQRAG